MKIDAMLGYRIFKEDKDNNLTLYRIIKMRKPASGSPSEVTVRDEYTKEEKKVRVEDLKDFTPLEPDAYLTFNAVHLLDGLGNVVQDVVITASKMLNLKIGDTRPFAICRQNVTDVFYNLICRNEDDMMAGLSINQEDCPTNFRFDNFLACDGIDNSQYVNYYRTDTLEDVLPMIKLTRMNEIQEKNYTIHAKTTKDTRVMFKKNDKGWCKDVITLLQENNFQSDIDQMLGITAVDFNISEILIKKPLSSGEGEYDSLPDDCVQWLSDLHQINITDNTVIKYDYDVDLVDYKNTRYFLLRDNTKTIYIVAYNLGEEVYEIDLLEKKDFSTKYRLDFYNKYNKSDNGNN